ncbi:MAG: protein-L-isoaspartate(D-aspartate) O-methyltransferase [Desulfamplus sp.]|nr:protein-L-isoaspartate(D-aspartate) O-methyltransferase [Desulfamplus sp.]
MRENFMKYDRWRKRMVDDQIVGRGITDMAAIAAMERVPRHLFVPDALVDSAYGDHPLPIGEGQTISQPYIIAEMTQALHLDEHDRVLEIGTGSGYQAAVLAEIVFRVYTIERNKTLFHKTRKLFDDLKYYNIVTKYGDGTQGWPGESPFDAIIVTAGGENIPQPLIDQLGMGGRLVMPVGGAMIQELILLEKNVRGVSVSSLGGCRFVKLIGRHGWQED